MAGGTCHDAPFTTLLTYSPHILHIMTQDNPVMEALLTRRSIRKYKQTAVPAELVDRIMEAGTYAASGKSRQPWKIIAITDPATQAKIREANARFLSHPMADPFYGAPVYLLVVSEKANPNHVYDGTLVMGNMMLAAHALGLGSCWINRAREMFELPEWQEWLRGLGIEGEHEGIGFLALGYTEGEPSPRLERKACIYRV